MIADRVPGRGPLAGIDAALAHVAARDPAATVVCVAGDMPFLQPPLLACLRDAPPALAVVPLLGAGPEPLCARYAPAFAPHAAAALAGGALALHALLATLPVTYLPEAELRRLDPTLATFTNVNTPQELAAADARAYDRRWMPSTTCQVATTVSSTSFSVRRLSGTTCALPSTAPAADAGSAGSRGDPSCRSTG